MQTRTTLRLGGLCRTRFGTGVFHGKRRPASAPLALPFCRKLSEPCPAAAGPTTASLRQFGSNPPKNPLVHATPNYMDYDTLVDMHLITRQSFGDRPLFGTKQEGQDSAPFEWVTYKDFGKQVDRCRAALSNLGIGKGDTVGIISNNRVEWAVCAYATYSLGAVFVPMYEEQVIFWMATFARAITI